MVLICFLLPEGSIWRKACSQIVNKGGGLVLRRTKPKVLKVAGNFFILQRVLLVSKQRVSTKKYYIWEISYFLPSYRSIQDDCKWKTACVLACIFYFFENSCISHVSSTLSCCILLQVLHYSAAHKPVCGNTTAHTSFKVHLTALSISFCVCVFVFHIPMLKDTQVGFKEWKSFFR